MRFEVNLSDFCIYYQQPTNNTPEFALRIGYMQQNLPHLLLLAYSAVAFSCLLDYLAPYFRGCRCSDIAAARSYSLRLYKAFVWRMPPAAPHQRRPSLPCSPRSSLVHRTTIAPASHLHRSFIALPSHLHHTFIARTLHSHYTYSLRTAHVVRTYFYV